MCFGAGNAPCLGLGENLGQMISVIGLVIDIAGAVVIALPDIPIINQAVEAGRLKKGIRELQYSGIIAGSPPFNEIKKYIERTRRIDIEDQIDEEIYGMYMEDEEEIEDSRHLIIEGRSGKKHPYKRFNRVSLQATIDLKEAKVRILGVLFLIAGFTLQIIGTLI